EAGGEVVERAACVTGRTRVKGDLDASLEVADPVRVARRNPRCPDRAQRARGDGAVADLLCNRERLAPELESPRPAALLAHGVGGVPRDGASACGRRWETPGKLHGTLAGRL